MLKQYTKLFVLTFAPLNEYRLTNFHIPYNITKDVTRTSHKIKLLLHSDYTLLYTKVLNDLSVKFGKGIFETRILRISTLSSSIIDEFAEASLFQIEEYIVLSDMLWRFGNNLALFLFEIWNNLYLRNIGKMVNVYVECPVCYI